MAGLLITLSAKQKDNHFLVSRSQNPDAVLYFCPDSESGGEARKGITVGRFWTHTKYMAQVFHLQILP